MLWLLYWSTFILCHLYGWQLKVYCCITCCEKSLKIKSCSNGSCSKPHVGVSSNRLFLLFLSQGIVNYLTKYRWMEDFFLLIWYFGDCFVLHCISIFPLSFSGTCCLRWYISFNLPTILWDRLIVSSSFSMFLFILLTVIF